MEEEDGEKTNQPRRLIAMAQSERGKIGDQ